MNGPISFVIAHLEQADVLPHPEFKQIGARSQAVIRSGESAPFAPVILVAGAWGFQL
jgi:D-ribose pyranose/furanose isomerase RbsD